MPAPLYDAADNVAGRCHNRDRHKGRVTRQQLQTENKTCRNAVKELLTGDEPFGKEHRQGKKARGTMQSHTSDKNDGPTAEHLGEPTNNASGPKQAELAQEKIG